MHKKQADAFIEKEFFKTKDELKQTAVAQFWEACQLFNDFEQQHALAMDIDTNNKSFSTTKLIFLKANAECLQKTQVELTVFEQADHI